MEEKKYSQEVIKLLDNAKNYAFSLGGNYLHPDHVLKILLDPKVTGPNHATSLINKTLKELVNPASEISEYIEKSLVKKLGSSSNNNVDFPTEIGITTLLAEALNRAKTEAILSNDVEINMSHLLLSILYNPTELVIEIQDMLSEKFSYEDLSDQYISELEESEGDSPSVSFSRIFSNMKNSSKSSVKQNSKKKNIKKATPALDAFSIDLTEKAKKGKIDPIIGRKDEINELVIVLGRRKKNNPVIVGPAGTGKTAIVEGIAREISLGKAPATLSGKRVVELDITSLVAGAKFRGEFEERIKAIINELEENPDIIIFIDEIHTMVGAGNTTGSMDASNILKPALARGGIQCIGATTPKEYKNSIEKDGALERRFQKILIQEPDVETTKEILSNLAPIYEDFHGVNYSRDVVDACVDLSEKYLMDRHNPDKSIDLLDTVGSKGKLSVVKNKPEEIKRLDESILDFENKITESIGNSLYEKAAEFRDSKKSLIEQRDLLITSWKESTKRVNITKDDILEVIAEKTGLDISQLKKTDLELLNSLSETIKNEVISQSDAIDSVIKKIIENKLGLNDANKPIGTFMFTGSTGVGKTKLAKSLKNNIFNSKKSKLIRLDMSEYSSAHEVSKLIGSPPGYIGYEEGGVLTEQVRQYPNSIILFDEIEKAHTNIYNMLLQILDEGHLTDNSGNNINFRQCLILMTSNVGAKKAEDFHSAVGFSSHDDRNNSEDSGNNDYQRGVIKKELKKTFPPEFLNRLDGVISFNKLSKESILKISTIEINKSIERFTNQGYKVKIDKSAKEFIASEGFSKEYGARPVVRTVDKYITNLLMELILSGKLTNKKGEKSVSLSYKKGNEKLSYSFRKTKIKG